MSYSNAAGLGQDNPKFVPFHDALNDGRLVAIRCEACARWVHLPKAACPTCGNTALHWAQAPVEGSVWSAIVINRTSTKDLQAKTPYTMGMVTLAPTLTVMAFLDDSDERVWAPGDQVVLDTDATKARHALVYRSA